MLIIEFLYVIVIINIILYLLSRLSNNLSLINFVVVQRNMHLLSLIGFRVEKSDWGPSGQ